MRVETIGAATLYLADNRDVLPTLARPDAVVSDPPYGMAWNTDSRRFTWSAGCGPKARKRGEGRADWGPIEGDAEPFDPAPLLALAPRVALWGSNHYAARLPIGRTLIWLKKRPELFGAFLSDAEIGWATGGHGVWAHYKQFPPPSRMKESGDGRVAHPTQKPISLMAWCIGLLKVPKGGVVLDPYMGSGTTGVAAVSGGFRFVGVESDPRYFETACRRIAAAQDAGLFAGAA